MLKYKGRLYKAYKPAPMNTRKTKRKALEAIKFFNQLLTESKDPHVKYFVEEEIHELSNVVGSLHYLVKYLPSEEDFKQWHEVASFSQLIDLLSGHGSVDERLDIMQRRLQDASEDASKWYDASLPDEFGDLKEHYEQEYDDGSFDTIIVPFVHKLFDVPKYAKYYNKYGEELRNIYEWNQHRVKYYNQGDDPHPPGVEDLEVVWHATTAYPKIMKEGFKLRSQLEGSGGLGGSMTTKDVEGISFTGNEEIARGILEAFWDMARLMQGSRTYEEFWEFAKSLKLPDETIKQYTDLGRMKPGDVVTDDYRAFDLARNIMSQASVIGHYYDPVFMGEEGTLRIFNNMKPGDAGIVEAIINTAHSKAQYFRSMDEWRVPLDAILSYGAVSTQEPKLEQLRQEKAASVHTAAETEYWSTVGTVGPDFVGEVLSTDKTEAIQLLKQLLKTAVKDGFKPKEKTLRIQHRPFSSIDTVRLYLIGAEAREETDEATDRILAELDKKGIVQLV